MTKKSLLIVILCSLVFGAFGSWVLTRYIIPKLSTVPLLIRYNLAPSAAPLVINTTQVVHQDSADGVAAVQAVKPWTVAVIDAPSGGTPSVIGSGLMLTSDGLIAVTKSEIAGQTALWVKTVDGTTAEATVKAADPSSDIVFIQAALKNQPTASFGNPDDMQLGQQLVAVWQGFGENQVESRSTTLSSATANIPVGQVLSSDQLMRTFAMSTTSDLAEGSVIATYDGAVQGIYSKTGIILSGTIQSALNSYFNNNNQIVRPSIGLYYEYLSPDLAALESTREGVQIKRPDPKTPAVAVGSPAAQAGLQEGDLIYKVNGTQIDGNNSFEDLIESHAPNDVLTFDLIRGGVDKVITVIVKAKQ